MKPGWQTSEFWLTLISAVAPIGASVGGVIPGPIGLAIAAFSTAAYSISRGLAKQAAPVPATVQTLPAQAGAS